MRVLLSSTHRYPAFGEIGIGPHPKAFPSGSSLYIHDLLAQGLAELGHEVFYLLRDGGEAPAPGGVTLVSETVSDADILHTITFRDEDLIAARQLRKQPWVATCHLDLKARGMERRSATGNWIFVSRTLAQSHDSNRYVLNGIDPSRYIYSETKDDYFLFMSTMDWGAEKGLDEVLSLSAEMGFKLVIAGTGKDYQSIRRVTEMCRQAGAEYMGDVKGRRKAELLAGAKAFLFPTKVVEAFGLGMVEALMSGTTVICSDRAASPGIISAALEIVS